MRTVLVALLAAACVPESGTLSRSHDMELPQPTVMVQVDGVPLRGGFVDNDPSTGLVSIVLSESPDPCREMTEGLLAELAMARGEEGLREGAVAVSDATTLTLQVETPWEPMTARGFAHGLTEGTFSAYVEAGMGDAFWRVSDEGALVLSADAHGASGRFEIGVEGETVWGWFDVDACPGYASARDELREALCLF